MTQFTDVVEQVLHANEGADPAVLAAAIEKKLGVREETVWGIWNEPNQAFTEAYQGQEWAARREAKINDSRIGFRTITSISNINGPWQETN